MYIYTYYVAVDGFRWAEADVAFSWDDVMSVDSLGAQIRFAPFDSAWIMRTVFT
jgi:hypothetical protein